MLDSAATFHELVPPGISDYSVSACKHVLPFTTASGATYHSSTVHELGCGVLRSLLGAASGIPLLPCVLKRYLAEELLFIVRPAARSANVSFRRSGKWRPPRFFKIGSSRNPRRARSVAGIGTVQLLDWRCIRYQRKQADLLNITRGMQRSPLHRVPHLDLVPVACQGNRRQLENAAV